MLQPWHWLCNIKGFCRVFYPGKGVHLGALLTKVWCGWWSVWQNHRSLLCLIIVDKSIRWLQIFWSSSLLTESRSLMPIILLRHELRTWMSDTFRPHISQPCSKTDRTRVWYILLLVFKRTFYWFHKEGFSSVMTPVTEANPDWNSDVHPPFGSTREPRYLNSGISSMGDCFRVLRWYTRIMTFVFKELILTLTRGDSSATLHSMDWVSERDSSNKQISSVLSWSVHSYKRIPSDSALEKKAWYILLGLGSKGEGFWFNFSAELKAFSFSIKFFLLSKFIFKLNCFAYLHYNFFLVFF